MLKSSIPSIVAAVLALPVAMASLPAQAATEARTQVVAYRLDLSRADQVDRLKARIALAAERVCGASERMTIAERRDSRACATQAKAAGLAQVGRAQVAASARDLTTARN